MIIDTKKFNELWEFRQVFVKIEKQKNSTLARITNDGWFVSSFYVKSENEAEFMDECKKYLETDEFKYALKRQRGF